MSWHPLLIAVLVLDGLALVFGLHAAWTHLRVVLRWEPGATDPGQVALEGAADGASIAGRYGIVAFAGASLLLVVAIALVLPVLVSGAMCGTGVLTATDGAGARALILRGLALAVLWIWRTLDGVDRRCPRPPAVPLLARWQLLSVPLVALAVLYTARAVAALDPYEPVDCCQQVYASFRTVEQATTTLGLGDGTWLALAGGGAALLVGLLAVGLVRIRRGRGAGWSAGGSLLVALLWLPAATVALVRVLAAYHYEVLHHHCPWCLFLSEHHAVGYPLFGALVLIALEALALYAAGRLGRRWPELLAEAARRRQRIALWLMLAALVALVALSVGPALAWRFEHGVWMSG